MTERAVNSSDIAKALGVSVAVVRGWMYNRSEPTITDALLLAEYLYVRDLRRIWQAEITTEEEESG